VRGRKRQYHPFDSMPHLPGLALGRYYPSSSCDHEYCLAYPGRGEFPGSADVGSSTGGCGRWALDWGGGGESRLESLRPH